MPNVVVYVPAKAWKALEEKGLDPAKTIREFARRGYEIGGQLPERERASEGMTTTQPEAVGRISSDEEGPKAQPPTSRSGSCPMSPPRGTKCKVCGKVHPL